MQTIPYPKKSAFLSLGAWFLLSLGAIGATNIIYFAGNDPNFPPEPRLDDFYNDGNSSIFTGRTTEGTLTADMSARYYDSDPLRPGTTGLINSDLPWNRPDPDTPDPGWVIRFGLNPDSVGSLLHTYDPGGSEEKMVPASYLKFNVRSPERVLFQSTTLQIDQVKGVTPSNIWAVVGDDNFNRIYLGKYTFTASDGNLLQWEWKDLEIDSTGLEIRVYGMLGADEGRFNVRSITLETDIPAVPEPGSVSLAALAALVLLNHRKRVPIA